MGALRHGDFCSSFAHECTAGMDTIKLGCCAMLIVNCRKAETFRVCSFGGSNEAKLSESKDTSSDSFFEIVFSGVNLINTNNRPPVDLLQDGDT